MQISNIVVIKKDAIEKGLLKEKCRRLLNKEGIIVKSGSAVCNDEVSVKFYGDTFDAWIMPKESLEIIREKKFVSLTPEQIEEAKALYLHLLNHIEVQEALKFRGMPCCKICNKSAYQIYAEESNKPEVNSSLPLDDKQEGGNGIPPTSKEVGILPKIL